MRDARGRIAGTGNHVSRPRLKTQWKRCLIVLGAISVAAVGTSAALSYRAGAIDFAIISAVVLIVAFVEYGPPWDRRS